MTKVFIEQLLKREKRSALINVSSIVSLAPAPGNAIYHASKAWINYFTASIG